ncbi:glycosyltransferase family 2 protein [Brevundimonas sp.]|uniref:glycosyltransferase family 2 protein n=1 Tax=Brevundimonas sp. TaxID=1871086 RepID=UPI0025F5E0DC|nr:glycosyltransferase family 2 protein [Brevundimonas sp.]
MSAPEVSVIVVTYESAPVLSRCLAQLRAQTFRDFEVILSDNGSTDGAAKAAARADPSLILLENGANLGFAEGNNRAARIAGGRWLALLNPDAFAEPDWLERLMAATRRHPEVKCFTSLQLAADDPAVLDGAGDTMTSTGLPYRMGWRKPRPDHIAEGEVFSPCGAAMLIERETFLELGGFEARFFSYCEDVDLGYRLRLAGGRTRLVPDAVVHHVGSSTLGARSDFAVFHGFRNRIWCFARNTPGLVLPFMAVAHLVATLLLLAGYVARGQARPALRGVAAALPEVWRMRREQRGRRGHALETLGAMTWSPLKTIRRALDIRPS